MECKTNTHVLSWALKTPCIQQAWTTPLPCVHYCWEMKNKPVSHAFWFQCHWQTKVSTSPIETLDASQSTED